MGELSTPSFVEPKAQCPFFFLSLLTVPWKLLSGLGPHLGHLLVPLPVMVPAMVGA